MGSLSIWHILILATIMLVLFGGRGKVSDLMGDFGRGIKSFRAGLNEPAPLSLRQSERAISPLQYDDQRSSTVIASSDADSISAK